jgi:hypothetical protein
MAIASGARRLAQVMAAVAAAGTVLTPVGVTAGWLVLAFVFRMTPEEIGANASAMSAVARVTQWGVHLDEVGLVTRPALAAGWLVALLTAAPTVIALWSVRRTFLEAGAGRAFSEASVRGFRRFAWASLAAVLAGMIGESATGLAVTVLSPEIQNQLSIGIGSEEVGRAFGALLLVSVAHMFAEGRQMAEDVEGLL